MADIPMLFSASMVRANIEGRKTNTRRGLVRLRRFGKITEFGPSNTPGYDWHFRDSGLRWHDLHHDELLPLLKAKVGDRIWVKEAWRVHGWATDVATIMYRASENQSYTEMTKQFPVAGRKYIAPTPNQRWRSSLHMPRWISRLTLTVTDVAVERLQNISEADAIAEGIKRHKSGWTPYSTAFYDGDGVTPANYHSDPRESYRQLWNKINGFGAWEANPWVVVYRYTVERRNIDAVAP